MLLSLISTSYALISARGNADATRHIGRDRVVDGRIDLDHAPTAEAESDWEQF
ncbi:hypothetical protein AAKU55_000867 [Oxalobacteraceae bacterium GrIS 1.11]